MFPLCDITGATMCVIAGAAAKESKGNRLEVKDEKMEKSVVTEETVAEEPDVAEGETAEAPAEKEEAEEVEEVKEAEEVKEVEEEKTEKAEEQKVRCPTLSWTLNQLSVVGRLQDLSLFWFTVKTIYFVYALHW